MGYYTGTGVVSSGGNAISVGGTLLYNGVKYLLLRALETTTVLPGVSRATAQAQKAKYNTYAPKFAATGDYPWVGACRVELQPQYAQIGDSNLFQLTVLRRRVDASIDGTNWVKMKATSPYYETYTESVLPSTIEPNYPS